MTGRRISAKTWLPVILLALLPLRAPAETGGTTQYRLDNGMEVILKENHSSPMVAGIIFIRSGSKYESTYENGITHFLEHLLFNGTVTRTREELDAAIDNLGGYINAFTRKELTAFFVLMPKQYIEFGMTVEADMLFNSIFSEEEMAKERKIVIEEINRDTDSPGAAADAFFMEKAYAGTDYNRPVLGYRAFIENITRQAVIDYWRRFYLPRNMTMLVIGDFETSEMKQTVSGIFGDIGDGTDDSTRATDPSERESAGSTTAETVLTGQNIFDTVANVTSTYINFSLAAPHHSDSGYLAMDLLSRFLGMDEVSPLVMALTGGANPLATEVGIDLATYSEFSRLEIYVITDNPDHRDTIVSTLLEQMKAIEQYEADPETIAGIRTSVRCNEIYNSQKLHYYGFLISSRIMSVGWDFIESYGDRLAEVTWDDCRQTAERWLTEPQYVATVVRPAADSGQVAYRPQGLSADEVKAHFDTVVFPPQELVAGHEITYPETEGAAFKLVDPAQYHREVLANGLTVIIKSDPDCRVFAANVLGRNRTANELPGKAGITDFVNRCLEKGTITYSAGELQHQLSLIGANTAFYDNPWIPYDDRYTTRRYSFLKFETIDEFAEQGLELFGDMVLNPAFDSAEVENIRRSMFGILARHGGSPSNVARDLFYTALFEGEAYAKSIMGTRGTIGSITAADLKAHHARQYSPENMILSIVTRRSVDEVRRWIADSFGAVPAVGFVSTPAGCPQPSDTMLQAHSDMEKKQIALYRGCLTPGAGSDDAVSLTVASSILSRRLGLTLREKQGLAYSVGASTHLDRDFGWFYTTIGTSPENYQQALDGIAFQIEKLQMDGPSQVELNRARNDLWGRLMRAKLSGINQAYYLGVNEYLGRSMDYDNDLLQQLTGVTATSVRTAASRYFRTDRGVLVSAGKRP
ncbi:MAG: pitrilysin family protein [bacterium]